MNSFRTYVFCIRYLVQLSKHISLTLTKQIRYLFKFENNFDLSFNIFNNYISKKNIIYITCILFIAFNYWLHVHVPMQIFQIYLNVYNIIQILIILFSHHHATNWSQDTYTSVHVPTVLQNNWRWIGLPMFYFATWRFW